MKIIKLINPGEVSKEEANNYRTRKAVRAVVMDNEGMIALLCVSKKNYYKLPGGGVEEGEDEISALQRECQEEIGCDVDIIKEIGSVVEYRKIFNLKQVSFCYLAKVKGEKREPDFTDKEKENGFQAMWLTYDEAVNALLESKATDVEGRDYIVPRDVTFLKKTNL